RTDAQRPERLNPHGRINLPTGQRRPRLPLPGRGGRRIDMFRALLYALLASSPLIAADAKTVEAVKNAERAWAAATVKGDAATLGNLLADDLTYTHSTGDTDTKKQFIANLSGARKYHKIEYESLDARLYLNGT